MADQVTQALSIKKDALLKIIGNRRDELQKDYDEKKKAFDDATEKVEKAVAKWVKANAKSLAEQAHEYARKSGYTDPSDSFDCTVKVDSAPELSVTVPPEPSDFELEQVKADYNILSLAEEKTIEVQPGSGNLGKYVDGKDVVA